MTAFAAAINAIFADPNMAVAATYRPRDGGADVACRVILQQADEVTDFGSSRIVSGTLRVDVRVAEVAAPVDGDLFIIGPRNVVVHGAPMLDSAGLVWRCGTVPEGEMDA